MEENYQQESTNENCACKKKRKPKKNIFQYRFNTKYKQNTKIFRIFSDLTGFEADEPENLHAVAPQYAEPESTHEKYKCARFSSKKLESMQIKVGTTGRKSTPPLPPSRKRNCRGVLRARGLKTLIDLLCRPKFENKDSLCARRLPRTLRQRT